MNVREGVGERRKHGRLGGVAFRRWRLLPGCRIGRFVTGSRSLMIPIRFHRLNSAVRVVVDSAGRLSSHNL